MFLLQRMAVSDLRQQQRSRIISISKVCRSMALLAPRTWGSLGFCSGNARTGSISGGGCTTTTYVAACISVGSGKIVPNIYLRTTHSTNIEIVLIRDGHTVDSVLLQGNDPPGSLLYGPTGYGAASGHIWQTIAVGVSSTDSLRWDALSPVQFT
jgi:hypothetical protein